MEGLPREVALVVGCDTGERKRHTLRGEVRPEQRQRLPPRDALRNADRRVGEVAEHQSPRGLVALVHLEQQVLRMTLGLDSLHEEQVGQGADVRADQRFEHVVRGRLAGAPDQVDQRWRAVVLRGDRREHRQQPAVVGVRDRARKLPQEPAMPAVGLHEPSHVGEPVQAQLSPVRGRDRLEDRRHDHAPRNLVLPQGSPDPPDDRADRELQDHRLISAAPCQDGAIRGRRSRLDAGQHVLAVSRREPAVRRRRLRVQQQRHLAARQARGASASRSSASRGP